MKTLSIVAFALLLLAFGPGVKAQYSWKITHSDRSVSELDTLQYEFNCVSCMGENCTAAGRIFHVGKPSAQITFFRSNDGGLTWSEQDPGLPQARDLTGIDIWFVQQLDSLNIIAAGDSGLIVRTTDAGNTWTRLQFPSKNNLFDIHFSDLSTGIVITEGVDTTIYTTNDSGKSWKGTYVPIQTWPVRGHSFGNGKFEVLTFEAGPFYTTLNNWQTVDTTIIYAQNDRVHFLNTCAFGNGDTIVLVGSYEPSVSGFFVTLTTNGLASWDTGITAGFRSFNNEWSDFHLYHNAIIRNGMIDIAGQESMIAHSPDFGGTWQIDTIMLDSSTFPLKQGHNFVVRSLTRTASGHIVGAYQPFLGSNAGQGYIIEGEPVSNSASVKEVAFTPNALTVFPNPLSQSTTIRFTSQQGPAEVSIVNLLGEEIARIYSGELDAGEHSFEWDAKDAAPGTYFCVVRTNDHVERASVLLAR